MVISVNRQRWLPSAASHAGQPVDKSRRIANLDDFNRKVASGVMRLRNKMFADDVVGVFLESPFTAADTLQLAAAGLCADPLQARAQPFIVPPPGINFLARVHLTVRVNSKVGNAHIYAKHAVPFGNDRLRHIDHNRPDSDRIETLSSPFQDRMRWS